MNSVTTPNGNQALLYDDKGRLNQITSFDDQILKYTYDGSLPLSETWNGVINGALQLTYNNDFKVVSSSLNGNVLNYQYDNDGLLTQVGDLTLTRDAQNGLLKETKLGNLTTQRTHSNFAELKEEVANYSNNELYHVYYTRDKGGRITQKQEIINGISKIFEYRYDVAGRLVEVKLDNSIIETYQYDANGNRLNNNAIYDAQDRLLQYGSNAFTYSQNGDLKTKNNSSFSYDVFGNLRSVTLPEKTIDYIIDARNRRVGKKINGQLVQGFLYSGKLKPIAELDANGNIVARFIYGSKINIPDYILKGNKTYQVISDHLGSPRLIVDISNGTIAQQIDYDTFGNILFDSNPNFQPFAFAGGLNDNDTSLIRFGARDYDPTIGRWTIKDPIRFSGGDSNLYGYVLNNPINLVDPKGLDVTITAYSSLSGHVGIGVNSNVTTGKYANFSNMQHSDGSKSRIELLLGQTVPALVEEDRGNPANSTIISTTIDQDAAISAYLVLQENNSSKYNFWTNNCVTFVQDALRTGGISSDPIINVGIPMTPNKFVNIMNSYYSNSETFFLY